LKHTSEIKYTLIEEQQIDYTMLYGDSYLVHIGWNRDLLERIKKSKLLMDPGSGLIKDIPFFEGVTNVLEKLGILYLDDELLKQEIPAEEIRQYLIQFHFYHWLYDSVACLDSIAILLNAKYKTKKPQEVKLNESFVGEIKKKDERIANLIEPELVWIKELRKDMRNIIMHCEGRIISGGGKNEPCYLVAPLRLLQRNVPLNRVEVVEIIDKYMPGIDCLTKETLEHLFPE